LAEKEWIPILCLSLIQEKSTIMTLSILLIFGLGTTELLLIALVVLLLFGGRKIPELMKGLGKGVKSFKDGIDGNEESAPKTEKKDPPADNTEKKE
jgi:sec-independent protein translocase protein TatA